MNAVRARVSESGRLNLPQSFRDAIGLDRGGEVLLELAGREIRIRNVGNVGDVIDQAQALTRRIVANRPEASLDAFLAARRGEAVR